MFIGEVDDTMMMMTEVRAVHELVRSGPKEVVQLATIVWPQ